MEKKIKDVIIIKFPLLVFQISNGFMIISTKKKKKFIPNNEFLKTFLTPLALAVWFMDEGSIASAGVKFASNSFCEADWKRMQFVLKDIYNLEVSIQKAGVEEKNQFIVYVPKSNMPLFSNIVKKHIVPSMHYKLNGY